MEKPNLHSQRSRWHLPLRALLFLLMIGYGLSVRASDSKVSINANGIALENVLKSIEQQTKYRFIYSKETINVSVPVTLSVKDEALTTVLDQLLTKHDIVYTFDKKQIVLNKKSAKANSQKGVQSVNNKVKVTGVVSDSQGEPLIGASVVANNGTGGVTTDIDGNYTIDIPLGTQLTFSYVGFTPYVKKISKAENLDVILQENVNSLDEVVVIGYGTTTRKNLTTSISTVKTDKISKAANSSVQSMLLGRAAGVQASVGSTQPGGAINISIRGGGNPIYVIDGVVMPNSSLETGSGDTGLPDNVQRSGLAGLNPGDIESIEILKDASAAIYGIGAADGVILITTKKGAEGKPKITYEGSFSLQKRYNYGMDRLNSREYMNMVNIFDKEKYLLNNNQYPYGNIAYDGKWMPVFSQNQIDAATDTDWLGYVLKTGHIHNHSVTVNGGTEKFKYYLGLNYFDEDGVVRNSGMQRYSLRTNVMAQLFPFLKLTTIVNLNKNKYENALVGGDTGNQGDAAAGYLYAAQHYPTYLPIFDNLGEYTIFGRIPNPVATLNIKDISRQSSWYVNFAADVNIIKQMLTARLIYGFNNESARRSSYIPSDVYWGLVKKSRGSLGYTERSYETMEGMINFNKKFWDALDVSAVVGMGRYVEKGNGMTVSYQNANDMIQDTNLGAADGPFNPTSYKYENEKRSQFARVNLILFDRYVLAATLRRDGTDKFFDDKKYSWFPLSPQ